MTRPSSEHGDCQFSVRGRDREAERDRIQDSDEGKWTDGSGSIIVKLSPRRVTTTSSRPTTALFELVSFLIFLNITLLFLMLKLNHAPPGPRQSLVARSTSRPSNHQSSSALKSYPCLPRIDTPIFCFLGCSIPGRYTIF